MPVVLVGFLPGMFLFFFSVEYFCDVFILFLGSVYHRQKVNVLDPRVSRPVLLVAYLKRGGYPYPPPGMFKTCGQGSVPSYRDGGCALMEKATTWVLSTRVSIECYHRPLRYWWYRSDKDLLDGDILSLCWWATDPYCFIFCSPLGVSSSLCLKLYDLSCQRSFIVIPVSPTDMDLFGTFCNSDSLGICSLIVVILIVCQSIIFCLLSLYGYRLKYEL